MIMTTLIFNRSKRNGKASQRTNANKRKDQKPRLARRGCRGRAQEGRFRGREGSRSKGWLTGHVQALHAFQHRRPRKRFEIDLVSYEDFILLAILFFFYSSFHPFIRTSSAFLRLSIYAASFETPVAVTLVHQLLMLMDRASPQVITNSSHSCWVADPSCARPGAPFASG